MRHIVSLGEFRSTLAHAFHHACNIPNRTTGSQASMTDLQDQPQQGAPVG
jgi:hypothetical protein